MMPRVSDVVSKYKEGSGMLKGVVCYRKETQRNGEKNRIDLFWQEMWWGVNDASLHKE